MIRRPLFSALATAAMTLPAFAHPGHGLGSGGLVSGFLHPLLGLDHTLAMLAVGIWAALLGGRAMWIVPTAFVICMLAGFGIAVAECILPGVEPGIAASILILGLLMAAAVRLPLARSAGLVGFFAVFHGHAHGVELAGPVAAFGIGFVAATTLLHGAGIVLGRYLLVEPRRFTLARSLGGAMAATGVALLGGWA